MSLALQKDQVRSFLKDDKKQLFPKPYIYTIVSNFQFNNNIDAFIFYIKNTYLKYFN